MKTVGQLVEKVALATSRAPFEASRTLEPKQEAQLFRARLVLAVGLVVALSAVIAPAYFSRIEAWQPFRATVPIAMSEWRILDEVKETPCAAHAQAPCPAAPGAPALWQSPFSQTGIEQEHQIREPRQNSYWLGTVISTEKLQEARRARAPRLVLGWVNASYHLWVDGVFYKDNKGGTDISPLILSLPMDRLATGKPLYLAFRISQDGEHRMADQLNSTVESAGFAGDASIDAFGVYTSFWSFTRPFAFLLSFLILAVMFFHLWFSSRHEHEYFYMSLHLLACAFLQARMIECLALNQDPLRFYTLGMVLETYRAAFGMFLGLSFARTRRLVFAFALPLVFVLPWAVVLGLPEVSSRRECLAFVCKNLVWVGYAIGGVQCLFQAYVMNGRRKSGPYFPVRIRRLVMFGLAMIALSLHYFAYYTSAAIVLHGYATAIWSGSEHFLLILFLGAIAAREYQHQAKLTQKAPLSTYHRADQLAERLEGIVLVADLKDSEAFYRQRADGNEFENLVEIWRSHLYAAATRNQGTVVYKRGDEIAVFFDQARSKEPLRDALEAIEGMARASALLERQVVAQGLMPEGVRGFQFRGALTLGPLRPTWEPFGEVREPAWEELGSDGVFTRAAALLERERSVPDAESRTLILVSPELSQQIAATGRASQVLLKIDEGVVMTPAREAA